MIVKAYELKKKNLTHCKYFLFYGSNKGLIDETINNTIKPLIPNNIYRYEENDIIMDPQKFEESLSSKSFFDDEKIIIISRASDKLYKILENIIEKDYDGIILVLTTNTLEKKSKIRNFFEKNRKSICVAFYEDNFQSLNFLAQKFLKEKKNFIVTRKH